jgi:integrase
MSSPNVRRRGERWTYYLYVTDAAGVRRQHSKGGFKTKREAEAARVRALNAIETGTYIKPDKLSVAHFLLEEWLPARRPPVLAESTWESYSRNIELHVVPAIGHIRLQRLDAVRLNLLYRELLDSGRKAVPPPIHRHHPVVIERVLQLRATGLAYEVVADRIAEEFPDAPVTLSRHAVAGICRRSAEPRHVVQPAGLSPRTVRYIHTILHAALKDALRWNRVVRNVADAATPPPVSAATAAPAKTWTAAELKAFLDFAADNRNLPAWLFLATAACRRGEALGLHWKDVDLDAGLATLRWQVTSIRHRIVVKERPKASRGHMIRLDSPTVAMLRSWKARQAEERLFLGPAYEDNDFVFCRGDGRPHQPDRFSREFERNQQYYNRDHPEAPLPIIKLHGLRHTWATLALQAGIDIKIVSDRLDHSSTHITHEIYTHVTPPMQSDAAERVAATIFKTTR